MDGQSSVIDSLQDLFLSSLNTFLKGSKYGAPQLKFVAPHLKYVAPQLKYGAFGPAKLTHPYSFICGDVAVHKGDHMTTPNKFDPEKDIQHFRLLTPTSTFVDLITANRPRASILNARLVYSWLAYRSRLDLPTSIRSVNRDIGLHAGTIRQALTDLGQLVEREGTDWYSVEPPPGYLHSRRAEHTTHWTDGLAYSLVYLPRKGAVIKYPETTVRFGLSHAIVWSHIFRNRNEKGRMLRFTIGGTAALYGLSDNTVRSVLKDLAWLKLITRIDRGGCSDIRVHYPSAENQSLFRLKVPKSEKAIPPVERRRPFVLRNDGWDKSRESCNGLMQQAVADELVAAAKELGETPNDFKNEISRLRQMYESNKLSNGKCGAYARAAYANRLAERRAIVERHAEEDRIATIMANTDWRAIQEEQEMAAAHDPLHRDFRYDEQAVFDRVDFGPDRWTAQKALKRLLDSMDAPINDHVRTNYKHLGTQAEVDLKSTLRGQIRRQALVGVNSFYKKEAKASVEEFKTALNDALDQLGLNKIFSPKMEAAKCLT